MPINIFFLPIKPIQVLFFRQAKPVLKVKTTYNIYVTVCAIHIINAVVVECDVIVKIEAYNLKQRKVLHH